MDTPSGSGTWSSGPADIKELEETLSGCNFAIYVKQPEPSGGEQNRPELVNEVFAANYMTPRLFRLFRGPSRTFPPADENPVQVLVRMPEKG